MKKLLSVVAIIMMLTFSMMADENEDYKKGGELFKQGKFEEALKLVDDSIKKYGETDRWLMGKYFILQALKRHGPALELAIKIDEKSPQKNPYTAFEIAGLYLEHKKDKDMAVTWLEKAVERGFQGYFFLENQPKYKPLRNHPRFKALVKKVKDGFGIGKPPKDFTVTLLSGDTFTLSKQTGKVILIDFWAAWCGPCVKEMPNVKKVYEQFKDKGFDIIGVSLDKTKDKLTNFIKENDLKWKIAFSGKFWQDDTARLYDVRSIPSTWIVDKKGNLRHMGLTGEDLGKAIAELVAE